MTKKTQNLSEQVKSRVNQQWDNISLPKDQVLSSQMFLGCC